MAAAIACGSMAATALAQGNDDGSSGQPIPRFVSLVASKVNMRTGPGVRYPVSWVYARPGLPVIVTTEFEHWRRVRDADGTEGWIHKSLLSGRRMGEVLSEIAVFRYEPLATAPVVFRAEAGVLGPLDACDGAWCRMTVEGRTGWVTRNAIFGALPGENFD